MSLNCPGFKWTAKRQRAALALAYGYTECEAADAAGVTDRTIRRWKNNLEFAAEVDVLTLMTGIATKAERLRIAMRVVRQKVQDDGKFLLTKADLIDWLKYAQSETDGVRLDLTSLFQTLEGGRESVESIQTTESGIHRDNGAVPRP